ncbi:crotonase/enoyl-CoA hydratase family protein [bacterium]|nr:crotonase/enoyl-CoA hydratase family protein [bacterium]
MSDDGRITIDRDGHLLLIGLDRPDKRNALSVAMYQGLSRAYAMLENDDELRCGVLYAHGEHFTGGLDLPQWVEWFQRGTMPIADDGLDPCQIYERGLNKPVVSAVQGICFTIGIELMLGTDVRVAADSTRFGQIEVRRGIYAACGATIRFVREIGWGNAMRYLLTGDEFSAGDAYRMGLVQEVVPAGAQLDRAKEIARTIADQAPLAVRATLRSSRTYTIEGEPTAVGRLMPDLAPLLASEDAQEGFLSYMERRKAEFKGK